MKTFFKGCGIAYHYTLFIHIYKLNKIIIIYVKYIVYYLHCDPEVGFASQGSDFLGSSEGGFQGSRAQSGFQSIQY